MRKSGLVPGLGVLAMSDEGKFRAAQSAMVELNIQTEGVIRIGLGTGSTARMFVDLLGEKVAGGFECICVPTSEETAAQARDLNIPLSDLDHLDRLDVTIDGTDEIDDEMFLIKGGGGALLREKIVAAASDRMVVIADSSKHVSQLGAFPLPIEVNPFGLKATQNAIARLMEQVGCAPKLSVRTGSMDKRFITDGGHYIIDACFGRISDARELSNSLLNIPGVVQHGMFLDLCDMAYIAGSQTTQTMGSNPSNRK